MSRGQIIAIVSAVVLLVSLFLAWGGVGGDIPTAPVVPEGAEGITEGLQEAAEDAASVTGWESQNTLDIYLAIIAALVLGNAVMMFVGDPDGLPFAPAAATFLLGVIGTILVAYVLIDVPEGAERKIGIYLAIAAVIGVTIGSYLQMRDEVYEADY
jgi:peptidoglycan/LPS O-acetylase OafA/YrhL